MKYYEVQKIAKDTIEYIKNEIHTGKGVTTTTTLSLSDGCELVERNHNIHVNIDNNNSGETSMTMNSIITDGITSKSIMVEN